MPGGGQSEDHSQWSFGRLLDWHLLRGTRPGGKIDQPGRRWGTKELADRVGVGDRTIRYWLKNEHLPPELETIERLLFGNDACYDEWRLELRRAHAAGVGNARPPSAPTPPLPASNIPIRVPEHFSGRDDALAAVETSLAPYGGRVAVSQAAVPVGELVVYFLVVVLALKYFATEGKEFVNSYGFSWLVMLFVAPFLAILAFSIVPTVIRARREGQLKRSVITGAQFFRPGYFRLTPYGKADRNAFKRLDGANDVIFDWLTSTQESLLYLSGASGVGKSSIMAASVGPALLDLGWTIVETRIFGEPIQHVRRTLLEAKGLFTQKPDTETGLRCLLVNAVEALTKKGGALLLIIDQFEEFLILNRAEQRAPFATFLQELAAKPIYGLRVLLVYRSDYRALIFKLALPPPTFGRNWIEIAPYNRGEATEFLQGGGRRFTEEALDALFRGLDRIEETRGIYRLVTLNMVGLILERMGRKIEEDPGRLVQRYLLDCLSSAEGHEFARPLLEHMISDAGTKEPRTESTLVELTGLEPWQVISGLTGLGAQGLVRRLEGAEPTWEVSHDFLARIIGRLIGSLRFSGAPSHFWRPLP